MRIRVLLYLIIVGLTVFATIEFVKNKKISKELRYSNNELDDLRDELDEANAKLDEVSEKLGSSADDISDKIDNIQSYASSLESSIDDLMREIRLANCDACYYIIWDIERKARSVESDFSELQSEINY